MSAIPFSAGPVRRRGFVQSVNSNISSIQLGSINRLAQLLRSAAQLFAGVCPRRTTASSSAHRANASRNETGGIERRKGSNSHALEAMAPYTRSSTSMMERYSRIVSAEGSIPRSSARYRRQAK